MKRMLLTLVVLAGVIYSYAQDAPNLANAAPLSPNMQENNKVTSMPVNYFTGMPQINVPIYTYANANSGLKMNVSLDYFPGGVQLGQAPGSVGLGWNLGGSGIISRVIRGMPDDMATNGFMYASAIPTDFRSNGSKYYYDSLDAEQDVFQYSFNGRSGRFFIGKNGQVVIVPLSKMKITPFTDPTSKQITSFRIVTEDGCKYDFNDAEQTGLTINNSVFPAGYAGITYNSAWNLSRIIAPFSTDTIKLTYVPHFIGHGFAFPQVGLFTTLTGPPAKTFLPAGSNGSTICKLSSVSFPDNTRIDFIYSYKYTYSDGDYALSRIKISDTAFRRGFWLDYRTTDAIDNPCRLLLLTVKPYTAKEIQNGYLFSYKTPLFAPLNSPGDTLQNRKDHWGFYNGIYNGTNAIPKISGSTWGADRSPDSVSALSNTITSVILPGGGYTVYSFELNDHYPYIKTPQTLTISGTTNTQNNISLSQVFNNKHHLFFNLDPSVSRTGAAPISGTGSLTVNIKSTDGTIQYATTTISLFDLFYLGVKLWAPIVNNGTYRLETILSGTTVTGSFPINVTWENKTVDNSKTAVTAGGLRIRRIARYRATNDVDGIYQEFKYVMADGKSSGFFGDIPKYDYPYKETVINGTTTTTNYTAISSEPVSTMNYIQGSTVGYSRVEVFEGTTTHNLGKTVYEFTNLQDVNANLITAAFPYAPPNVRDWGLGQPEQVSVYDSLGTLVRRTRNLYGMDTANYVSTDFKSLKLGNSFTQYNGDPSQASTPRTRTFVGQEYYASSGRAYITATYDTLFKGSTNITDIKSYVYDTNYNVVKVTSNYDRTRGLSLETRLYYPYNYTITGAIGKLRDSGIIAGPVSTETWITGDANPRIVSGNITDFQQLAAGYIKPLTVYNLESNAPVPQTTIGAFNASVLNRNSTYFKPQKNFGVYDSEANLLQTQNAATGVYNTVIMDYNKQYTVAKVSNAANSDVAYTSFESDGTGNWSVASTTRDTIESFTGRKSYDLTNGSVSKSGLSSAQTYLVTLWGACGITINVNGVSIGSAIATTTYGWCLYNKTVTGVTSITITGQGPIDEVRLHPASANMVTSTYEPMIGMIASVDANNTISYTEYDQMNRVKVIRDRNKNIIKRYDYEDAPTLITLSPVWGNGTIQCETNGTGYQDSVYTDTNPYSDTYNKKNYIVLGPNYCACSSVTPHPDYKLVNGVCEQGCRVNTATAYVKVNNVFVWRCTYHYQWSDGSISQDYTEYNSSACSIGGGCNGV